MNDDPLLFQLPFASPREVSETLRSNMGEEVDPTPSREQVQAIDMIAHLLRLGQLLCTLKERQVEFLCREIQTITRQRASLHFRDQAAPPPNAFSLHPLQFNSFRYGYLAIMPDEARPQYPAIPLFAAHMMAEGLSYILYTLEQHLLLQSLGKQWQSGGSIKLTKREQDVLALICRGYTQEEMAQFLEVSLSTIGTHRQHIYEQLDAHNEYEARLAAYHLGLFSFLRSEDESIGI